MPVVTIGFSLHRPEMVPQVVRHMRGNDALFLEDPPSPEFDRMLSGKLSVDDYVMMSDAEYPQFTAMMCAALRDFKAQGKLIYQVEPYLENLLALHDFFAAGRRPDELEQDSLTNLVYICEKRATGALLAYYEAAAGGSFERTVAAVKRFAEADAERFRLRDALRSRALAALMGRHAACFIEAGVMHYPMKDLLRRQANRNTTVRAVFLADEILRKIGLAGHLYGPGDRLTLLFIRQSGKRDGEKETLLAARALIHSKITIKEEVSDDGSSYPHLRDELLCIDVVRQLTLDDCRRLFSRIRRVDTTEARDSVAAYISGSRPRLARRLKTSLPSEPTYEGQNCREADAFR